MTCSPASADRGAAKPELFQNTVKKYLTNLYLYPLFSPEMHRSRQGTATRITRQKGQFIGAAGILCFKHRECCGAVNMCWMNLKK